MADMKTTQERRDRFREWLHDDTRDHMSIRAWCVAEDACHDVDTLLAENARLRAEVAYLADGRPLDAIRRTAAEMVKLRAVAEAARDMMSVHLNDAGPEAFRTLTAMRVALVAMEAP